MKVNGYEIKPGADLARAGLFKANLSGADLSGANLFGANLSGADLLAVLATQCVSYEVAQRLYNCISKRDRKQIFSLYSPHMTFWVIGKTKRMMKIAPDEVNGLITHGFAKRAGNKLYFNADT